MNKNIVDTSATARRESRPEVDQHQQVGDDQPDALYDAQRLEITGQRECAQMREFPGQQLECRSRKGTPRSERFSIGHDPDPENPLAKPTAASRGIRQPEIYPDRNREIQDQHAPYFRTAGRTVADRLLN